MNIEQITSRDNRRLVHARKVREGKVAGRMFVEGTRLVREALRSDVVVDECFVSNEFDDDKLRNALPGPIYEVRSRLFSSIAETDNPQGIVLIAQRPAAGSMSFGEASTVPVVVYLHEVNNPSNLGAVIRTAEAAGIAGVIISKNSADVFSPKALRSAMGSSFRVPIWENVEFGGALRWAQEHGLSTTAADVSQAAQPYTRVDWKKKRLLIFGSEAHGLADVQIAAVDEQVRIPMESKVESLNLAVSAGIILFEARRQNQV